MLALFITALFVILFFFFRREKHNFGGTYESIIKNPTFEKFFSVTRSKNKTKKNTQIRPNISAIKQEVEAKKAGKSYIRFLREGDKVEKAPKSIFEPSVRTSESLTRQKSKARALSDSVQISERLGMVVTRANPKELSK